MSADAQKSPRRKRLVVDLGALHAPWLAQCAARGVTPRDAVRAFIHGQLEQGRAANADHAAPVATASATQDDPKRVRLEFSLSESENAALSALADQHTCNRQALLLNMIRTYVVSTGYLTQAELAAMRSSTFHLGAIGKNLNMIARALQGDSGVTLTVTAVREIAAEIRAHITVAAGLQRAAARRPLLRLTGSSTGSGSPAHAVPTAKGDAKVKAEEGGRVQ